MNLLKRIKNLWNISALHIPKGKEDKIIEGATQENDQVPKLAQIIKRKTPAQEFLKENE